MTTAKDEFLKLIRGSNTAKSLAALALERHPGMMSVLSASEREEARQVLEEFGGVEAFNQHMADKRQREAL